MRQSAWILLFLVPLIEGNILEDVINRFQNEKDKTNVCSIPTDRQLLRCDVQPLHNVVPEGTMCSFIETDYSRSERVVVNYVCESGMLIAMNHMHRGTGEHRVIRKRFIGALIGIIGIVTSIGSIVCGLFCPSGSSSSDGSSNSVNQPPTITCPDVVDKFITSRLQDTIVITWDEPTATDPEGESVEISRTGDQSGSSFGSGSHVITYTASDDKGNKDTCNIRFQVSVIYCLKSLYLENGKIDCDTSSRIFGTSCMFSCNNGYQLSSDNSSTVACDISNSEGTWAPSSHVTCNKKVCHSPHHPCNGRSRLTCSSDNYEHGTICYPVCNDGYSTDSTKSIVCNGDQWTGVIDPCLDSEEPKFTFCPTTIRKIADRPNGETIVKWSTPIVSDNSKNEESCGFGSSVEIQQIQGLPSGSSFEVGYHHILYNATDSSSNIAQCTFVVIIEELSCDPLVMDDEFVLVTCPNGYTYGSTCSLACFMSYKLVGDVNVTCERNKSAEDKSFWNWNNETQAFCQKLSCPKLPVPEGGALACSTASGSEVCTMSCSNKYQVAKGTPITYICSDEQIWIQGIPPNCTDKVHPRNAIGEGEFFLYYEGDCSDQTTIKTIEKHFIETVRREERTEGWSNLCSGNCTIEDVIVDCGAQNGKRRKRSTESDAFHKMFKRSTEPVKITLNFKLTFPWQSDKGLWGNNEIYTKLSGFMSNRMKEFDFPNVTTGSMKFGWLEYNCPLGQVPTYNDDGTCVGCFPGQYLDNDDCLDCSKGYYQDKAYQINCEKCPSNQSTESTRSTSKNDCQDVCQPGTYSNTGIVPCSPCPLGHYQHDYGATVCLSCPLHTFTLSTGSNDCQRMDVSFTTENGLMNLRSLPSNIDDYTLSVLFKLNSNSQCIAVTLANFQIKIGIDIEISVASNEYSFIVPNATVSTVWNRASIVWKKSLQEASFFWNGNKITSHIFDTATTEEIQVIGDSSIQIVALSIECSYTGFMFATEALSDSTIEDLAKSCFQTLDGVVLTMHDLYISEKSDTQLTYSKCDVFDECISSPCGQGNVCVNKQSGYQCKCLGGYSGDNCEVPPDFCELNDCRNGATCASHFSNYTCHCSVGFTGTFCESEIVNGNWGSWLSWSECSASCEGGTQTRERYCNNPTPDRYGLACVGSSTSNQSCNIDPCPVCPDFFKIYAYKNAFNCTMAADTISCTVSCQDGYTFVRDYLPLDLYQCGPVTGFTWNARPPPCAGIYNYVYY
ncbi:sushi, von Willebrand factor type A, EGF and pentraxin domain-containing protein 1-like [Mytilus californianus]|uniref:sushi, von Willebrand factor type A, EGF and pentraxin domain-containing protein 1-like n=1 Tax=Mytilus californianus TaxID=6549 RepID=UPI0022485917|nr:sushi, von Willebrand factor type A, EGF and pentraxin domain-containing protein 1-like [Mytilus californianus]